MIKSTQLTFSCILSLVLFCFTEVETLTKEIHRLAEKRGEDFTEDTTGMFDALLSQSMDGSDTHSCVIHYNTRVTHTQLMPRACARWCMNV